MEDISKAIVEIPTVVLLCLFQGLVAGLLRLDFLLSKLSKAQSNGKFRERHTHPHQDRQIFSSCWNVRQKVAIATPHLGSYCIRECYWSTKTTIWPQCVLCGAAQSDVYSYMYMCESRGKVYFIYEDRYTTVTTLL
jgi:hypothetical protein